MMNPETTNPTRFALNQASGEAAKLKAENERLRALLSIVLEDHDRRVSDGSTFYKGMLHSWRAEDLRAALAATKG